MDSSGNFYLVIPSQVSRLFIENCFHISKRQSTRPTQKSSTHSKDSLVSRSRVNIRFQCLIKNYPDSDPTSDFSLQLWHCFCRSPDSPALPAPHLPRVQWASPWNRWPHLSFWQWENWVQPIASSILSSSGKGSLPQRWRNKESLPQSDPSLQMKTSPRPPTPRTWVPSHPTGDARGKEERQEQHRSLLTGGQTRGLLQYSKSQLWFDPHTTVSGKTDPVLSEVGEAGNQLRGSS